MNKFSFYIEKFHVRFLDNIEKLDGVAVHGFDDHAFVLSVKIDFTFYKVGFFDVVRNEIRLIGPWIGSDDILNNVNSIIKNVETIHSTDVMEAIFSELHYMICLQDFLISEDRHNDQITIETTRTL